MTTLQKAQVINMSHTKHTPGPWFADNGYVQDDGHLEVATCPDNRNIFETNANARLIAAAPELLSLLKQLHDFVAHVPGETDVTTMCSQTHYRNLVFDITQAIAKAEGK